MYADYPDSDLKEIASLSEELNRPASRSQTTTSSSSWTPDTLSIPALVHQAGGLDAVGSGAPRRTSPGPYKGSPAPRTSNSATANSTNGTQLLVPKYLELCINTGKLSQSLCEIDVTRFSSDIELFRWIRRKYSETRGWRMHSRFCLRPKSMRFVYFKLEQKTKVHVLCRDESLPSQDDVSAGRYHCDPCPVKPEGTMPMPSDAFVHYLHYCNLNIDGPPG